MGTAARRPHSGSCSDDADDLRAAFDLLESLGARPAAATVARRMRLGGVRGVRRGARPTTRANPAGLTARELEVLLLIVGGLRNTEIADQLVPSPNPSYHPVSSVPATLGVSRRYAPAREAVRLGIQDGELAAPR